MIVIQTQAQKKLLEKFGQNGLCCDTTHGTTGYDFLLMTLLVVDEFGQGQPAAWYLSNHETESFLKIFFEKVKTQVGPMQPIWFMTDLAPQFYNTYCFVNECQPKRLFCTWHVDKAWKEELRRKIGNLEIEASVYKLLRTVLEETNEKVFDDQLASLVDKLSSNATIEFKKYFVQNWVNIKTHWGYCYRVGDGINTNMFVEAFHRTFKYNYLKGKYNKRVDTVLVNLLKFKTFARLIKLTKGALTQRMKTIQERHLSSKKMCFSLIKETEDTNVFMIKSEDGKRNYSTSKLSDNCEVSGCRLRCIECSVCTHSYHCNCPDFLINNTSCKHVHLLKRYLVANDKTDIVTGDVYDAAQ